MGIQGVRMSGFPDPCGRCGAKAEYSVLLEGDENPARSSSEYLCAECLEKAKPAVIEAWTWAEWVNFE
jgi:hypothetical protein